ncbi:MAG TPA: hypothetical protein VMS93_02555 [Candidatus Saccharimonadales bacterium]|nr:hypothetical protein [Candidatus Saccharimonadales bacterium]
MRAFLGWVFSNWGVKLMALVLAVLVFAHVATDREQDLNFRVPLRLVNLSDTVIALGRVPEDAMVSFRGKGRDIYLSLLRGTWVQCDLAQVGPGTLRHLLSPRDVKLPVGLNVTASRVAEPETLALQLDRRLHLRLPVRVVAEPADSTLVARAEPESVSVDGPASVLARMAWVPAAAVRPRHPSAGASGVVPLNPGSPYVVVTPPQVRVRWMTP